MHSKAESIREIGSGGNTRKRELAPGLVESLRSVAAYPNDASAKSQPIEHRQTHISHLFLTNDRVYKLRKCVTLPFLDFASRGERDADCLREVSLNRRLAPDVYLGVAGLRAEGDPFAVGPLLDSLDEQAVEHCVVMRRLPEGRDALTLLERDELTDTQIERVAETIAAFHANHGLGTPAPWPASVWADRILEPFIDAIKLAGDARTTAIPAELPRELESLARQRVRGLVDAIELRRSEGRAVEGHGDLHLPHLWFESDDAPPSIIDALEFREDWRQLDAASEVAFLAMDLIYRDRRDLAEHFLAAYAREMDDFGLYSVVDFYIAYRAAVRGSVAAVAATDPGIGTEQRRAAGTSARRHLELARDALAMRKRGGLIVLCGTVGSGKSTVAREAARLLDGVVVSSDRTRKRLAGVAASEPAPSGSYEGDATARVYRALHDRAGPIVASGRDAVLDATFSSALERARSRCWATDRGIEALLIETRCGEETAHQRLAARHQRGNDPSDAGPERLRPSLEGFEPPEEWDDDRRLEIDTESPSWRRSLEEALSRWQDGDRVQARDQARASANTPDGALQVSEASRPSRVRDSILDQHREITSLLDQVEASAQQVRGGSSGAARNLRKRGQVLLEYFHRHLDYEDRWLVPALRKAGAWSSEQADQLAREHRDQRVLLDFLLNQLDPGDKPSRVLADQLLGFVALMRDDMAHEERAVLDRDTFRDEGFDASAAPEGSA